MWLPFLVRFSFFSNYARNGGKGGGGGATGIRVGYVDQNTTAFPTTRPDGAPLQKEDYVSVSSVAELPFTIGSITFNSKRDTAVWTGGQWVLSAGAVIETNEVFLKQKTRESLSGTQTIQSATNIEFANAIGRNVNISVDDKTNLIEALNYVWVECKKAGYTFTITNTDNDSVRSIVFNVKDKDNNVLINKTLNDFILKTRKVAGYDLADDITAQEIQDAIKELTATLKNKTMSADDNTFTDFETDNFKNSALAKSTDNVRSYEDSVDTKLVAEKFLQKTLRNISTPTQDNYAANKKYVDDELASLSGKVMKFKGFISSTTPTETITDGSIWYESANLPTIFPINVKTYINNAWSSTTSEYTPSQLDLFSNLNNDKGYYWFGNSWNLMDENVLTDDITITKNLNGELEFKKKTANDKDKVWKINASGGWDLSLIQEWLLVNTWVGLTPNDYTLYILSQDITISGKKYEKGFYTYDTTENDYIQRSGTGTIKDIQVDSTSIVDNDGVVNVETDNDFIDSLFEGLPNVNPIDINDLLTDDTDYTSSPTDDSKLANVDLSSEKVKHITFGNLWTWITNKITGAISTVITDNLTADRAVITNANGKIAVAGAVTANTTNGWKTFAVDKYGRVYAYTAKSLDSNSFTDSSNTITLKDLITAATTNDRMYPIKVDAKGRITALGTGHAISSEYTSGANNQLFTRNGAYNLWTEATKVSNMNESSVGLVFQGLENSFVHHQTIWAVQITKKVFAISFEIYRNASTSAGTEVRVLNSANNFKVGGNTVRAGSFSAVSVYDSSSVGAVYNGGTFFINPTRNLGSGTSYLIRITGIVYCN